MPSKKSVRVGNVIIGGGNKIAVQSMLNTKTSDISASLLQIKQLEDAGCDIVRVAVPDEAAAKAIYRLKEHSRIPIVADIHFSHRLALLAADAGADKIRINPGNLAKDKVSVVANACKAKNIPIRIGVNGGSVSKEILSRFGKVTPEALVESALENIKLLNECDFDDICISLKSSSVLLTVEAYRLMSSRFDYPLHLGVTEAGTERMGIIKSAVGIGSLLLDGIGDTIRVSLTDSPVKEVYAAFDILKSIGLKKGIEIVSCPTCGRTEINIISIANELNEKLASSEKPLKVAVMGCAVNGPGEARDADIGIAGGKNEALLFKKGEIIRKINENEIIPVLLDEIEKL